MAIKINKNIVIEDTNVALKDLPEVYSTNEIKTSGIWNDGKSIYRKIITYTNSSTIGGLGTTSNVNIPHGISGFGTIVNWSGRRGATLLPSIGGWSAVDRAVYVSEINSTNIVLTLRNDDFSAGNTFTFVIEYTKSS